MSNKASPLTFKAGGKTTSSSPSGKNSKNPNKNTRNDNRHAKLLHSPRRPPPSSSSSSSSSNILSVVQTGLSNKRSPFQLKNWIACILTLDGRDKFTKVLQYASRLLVWHFAGLANRSGVRAGAGLAASSNNGSDAAGVVAPAAALTSLHALCSDPRLRRRLYAALSRRFDDLYKSLVTSRKAFRLGRSVIEMDKLKSMGWGDYLGYMVTHPLAGGAADRRAAAERGGKTTAARPASDRYGTHRIPEEGGIRGEGDRDDESGWSEEVADADGEKMDHRVPSSDPTHVTDGASSNRPFPTRSSSTGSRRRPKDPTTSSVGKSSAEASPPSSSATTPSWKLVGGTIKLMGLMGFWAFDNLSFLTSTGFLDPIHLHSSSSNAAAAGIAGASASSAKSDHIEHRMRRKKHLSEFAGRCYFLGILAGLYVNARTIWCHRNGLLRDARDGFDEALRRSTGSFYATSTRRNDDGDDNGNTEVKEAKTRLRQTERKHFELLLALLKSCCDFMVFSNNPGIDLYSTLLGRKNHEGLHCLGGLVSASTVLYNNFPNA